MGRKRILAIVALAAILAGVALFSFRSRILAAVGDFLVVQDPLLPADLIAIIAGEDNRTDYAIELYEQGLGQQLFFTGGWCTVHDYYHGQHGRARAIGQGVPPEAIVVDDSPVTSTYSEAVRLQEFIAQSRVPIRSVIVVSDAYHMRRARWTYRRLLGDGIRVQMAPVPFAESPYPRRWWTDAASRAYVRDEYLKIVYYHARYQLSWGALKKWLASLDRK